MFLQMIEQVQGVEGLKLPRGKLLKILSFPDNHQVLSRTALSSLDACDAENIEYELV